jgi:hypothetical protein
MADDAERKGGAAAGKVALSSKAAWFPFRPLVEAWRAAKAAEPDASARYDPTSPGMGGKVLLVVPGSVGGKSEPFSVAALTWLETYADGNAMKCFCGQESGTLGETVFFAGSDRR